MKTIMCFGDSNTWGYIPGPGTPPADSVNRFPWDVRWTGRLQRLLGGDYRVVEEGLNGRTTMFDCPMDDHRNGLKAIDACLLTHAPIDLVIIMLGTNDTKLTFRMPENVIARGLERLIERVRAGGHGPDCGNPEVLAVAPIRMGPADKCWVRDEFDATSVAVARKLAPAFAQVAEKNGVHFFDAGAHIAADPADCIHMNAEGHAALAQLLRDEVTRILG